MNFIKEFREFAVKGNMFDMAIGIIIGAAFSTVVSSLVEDVLMPLLGMLTGGIDLSSQAIVLKEASETSEAVLISYGHFIQATLDFLLVAISLFLVISLINRLKRKAEDEKDESTPTPKDIELLTEIRDLLKK